MTNRNGRSARPVWHAGGQPIADGGETGVAADPLSERRMPDQAAIPWTD